MIKTFTSLPDIVLMSHVIFYGLPFSTQQAIDAHLRAMLFWKTLTLNLMGMGFEINPYNECVSNKVINERRCAILWHIDDIKVSFADHWVVTGKVIR